MNASPEDLAHVALAAGSLEPVHVPRARPQRYAYNPHTIPCAATASRTGERCRKEGLKRYGGHCWKHRP